jgi:hypothetical protein
MNYQPQYRRTGMLSDLAPQEQGDLSQLLTYMDQPEYTQQPMMLAQAQPNQLQRMLGTQGDGVSAQTKAGIEKNLPGFYGTKAPEPDAPGYTPGTDAFAGGRTLRLGYESFGPMNDAEFAALMKARGKK